MLLFKISFVLITFACLCSFPDVAAQGRVAVRAQAMSHNDGPLAFATVALYPANSDAATTVAFSDSLGIFTLSAGDYGDYKIGIESMGYTAYRSAVVSLYKDRPEADLGIIYLEENSTALNMVTIAATKPLIEHQLDKIVLHVENSILAEGNTALEVLAKAPGVQVDNDGNLMLRGKQGVTVMIDGKLTYLSQKDLANFLKSTPASSIKSIEVIANPSARYDAAGNSGIINIKLKKNAAEGLNGNAYANYGQGRKERYGAGVSINYRADRWNVSGNYDHAFRGEKEYVSIVRNFYESGIAEAVPDFVSYQQSVTDEPLRTHNFKLGTDYYLAGQTILGFVLNGRAGTYENRSTGSNDVHDYASQAVRSAADTRNGNKEHWLNMSYNLNFSHQFKNNGGSLSADIDYSDADFEAGQSLEAIYTATPLIPAGSSLRRGSIPSRTKVYVGKVDYSIPVNENGNLEAGWKNSAVNSDNNARYDTMTHYGWQNDAGTTNHFVYKEQIHAGYLNYRQQWGKTQLQAGLRAEYTATEAHQVTSDSLVHRHYLQWFPGIAVKQNLDASHTLQLSYAKRIDRPDYFDLNPFRFYVDPFLFMQGNPYLQPQLSHNFEMAYSWQGRFSASVYFTQTNDVLTDVLQQIDDENITIRSTQNLSTQRNYGATLSGTFQPTGWLSSTNFATVYSNRYAGSYLGYDINNSRVTYILNSQNAINLGSGYSAELSGRYVSGTAYGVFTRKPYADVSAGIQKKLLKGKGTIKAAITDIFRTHNYYVSSLHRNINLMQRNRLDSRIMTVSFSYRFKTKEDSQRKRNAGNEDLQDRLKG